MSRALPEQLLELFNTDYLNRKLDTDELSNVCDLIGLRDVVQYKGILLKRLDFSYHKDKTLNKTFWIVNFNRKILVRLESLVWHPVNDLPPRALPENIESSFIGKCG